MASAGESGQRAANTARQAADSKWIDRTARVGLDLSELGPGARSAVINLGKVGYIARGIVFTLVGILVVAAAVTFDPDKAGGMDAALRQVAAQPYGRGCSA